MVATMMTVLPVVPLVSLVFIGVSAWCFGDCSACSASGVFICALISFC